MIYPEMSAEELRDLCALAGRPLTNDEAQELVKELTIYRAWEAWLNGKNNLSSGSLHERGSFIRSKEDQT